jgi:hypothetical protein
MFQTEMQYFIEHQAELVSKYRGQVLAIQGQSILGAYRTALEAYLETQKTHPLGTFMLQPCEPGPEAYTVTVATHDLFGYPA